MRFLRKAALVSVQSIISVKRQASMERLYKRLLEDDSIIHRAVGLREGISLVLDAEHGDSPLDTPLPL